MHWKTFKNNFHAKLLLRLVDYLTIIASVASQLSTTEKSVVLTFHAAARLTISTSSTVAPPVALSDGGKQGNSVTANK